MNKTTRQTIALTIISGLMVGTLVAAEGEQKSGKGRNFPGAGELHAYRVKQHKVREEYRQERRDENEAFRETLKEKEATEALPLIISNRQTQYAETKTFMTGLYTDFVAYAKGIFEKHEVPADKQEQFLTKCGERHDEMEAKHDEYHNKLIAALEALKGNEELTMQQIKAVFRENTPDRKGGHGKGHGRQKGKGKKAD